MITLTTLTYSLPLQLWHTRFHSNSDMLTFTTDLFALTTLTYSLSNHWHALSHCSVMVTLTSLTLWLGWGQAGSGGSSYAGMGETSFGGSSGSGFTGRKLVIVQRSLSTLWQSGFAGSKLLVLALALLVAVDLALLGAVDLALLEQAGSSGILTLTSLTIWLHGEQVGSSGSGFAGSGQTSVAGSSGSGITGMGETGFIGSKMVAVDLALLVGVKLGLLVAVDLASMIGVKLASLGASC